MIEFNHQVLKCNDNIMKKIYLAIPYTGTEEESFKQSSIIGAKLIDEGHIVFSPISMSHPMAIYGDKPSHFEYWKQLDEEFIRWADEVWLIWHENIGTSKGVKSEIEYARKLNKPIYLYYPVYHYIQKLDFNKDWIRWDNEIRKYRTKSKIFNNYSELEKYIEYE